MYYNTIIYKYNINIFFKYFFLIFFIFKFKIKKNPKNHRKTLKNPPKHINPKTSYIFLRFVGM